MVRLKVLELYESMRPSVLDCAHKLIKGIVVFLPPKARLLQAKVIRVVQKTLVVGAAVEHDWEHLPWVDAPGGAIKSQFAYGYAHPVRAEVTQAEDPRSVGDHDDFHVVMGPVVHHSSHHSTVLR